MPVIEPVAVADVEALLAAIAPDRELHEPGKDLRKAAVELLCVDFAGYEPNDVGAAAWAVTAEAVRMRGVEPGQDAGPVQEIMDQGVNRNQLHANLQPPGPNISGADQNAGQRHSEHFVRDAVNIAQRLNQAAARLWERVRTGLVSCLVQPVIDPADQVAVSNVPNKQVQAVGNLVEVAVSQPMSRQRASGNVVGLGAGATGLFVAAAMKMPIGFQLRATWSFSQILADCGPGRLAMAGHVIYGDLVRDPLKTKIMHQPVEQDRIIMTVNGSTQSWIMKLFDQVK